MNPSLHGDIFVISAPSGTGKTTLIKHLLKARPNLIFSVSYTTRSPRPGEVHGKDYFFVDKETFEQKIKQGEMIEWAEVYGNYYGTSAQFVQSQIGQGHDVILDIDIQGAYQVKKRFPEAILIFIAPPSLQELKRRLLKRGTDSLDVIEKRLKAATKELLAAKEFDYIVINDNLDTALEELKSIITASKATSHKRWPFVNDLLKTACKTG